MNIDEPSQYDFELRINIYAYDKSGGEYKLILHSGKDINDPTSIVLNYSDLIRKGDIIREKIIKALAEDYQIQKVSDVEFFEIPNEEDDLDTDGFEYMANVVVDYKPEYEIQIGDLYSTWIRVDDGEMD